MSLSPAAQAWLSARALSAFAENMARDFGVRFYADRITFPVRSLRGEPLWTLVRNLNSSHRYEIPDHIRRGVTLFGIDKTWQAIQTSGFAVVTEGPADFLALYYAGVDNTCALLTARVSAMQRGIMAALAGDAVFWLDGDATGADAAQRAGATEDRLLRSTGMVVRGLDPASAVAAGCDVMGLLARVDQARTQCSFLALDRTGQVLTAASR